MLDGFTALVGVVPLWLFGAAGTVAVEDVRTVLAPSAVFDTVSVEDAAVGVTEVVLEMVTDVLVVLALEEVEVPEGVVEAELEAEPEPEPELVVGEELVEPECEGDEDVPLFEFVPVPEGVVEPDEDVVLCDSVPVTEVVEDVFVECVVVDEEVCVEVVVEEEED